MTTIVIAAEDPRSPDIVDLLEAHLALMRRISPPGHVHALDVESLTGPAITFLTPRRGGELVGVAALNVLDAHRAEIKSMHTTPTARGQGVGRLLVQHVIRLAVEQHITWLGLETGTQAEFEPARTLYRSFGFRVCTSFGADTVNPHSTCMALDLEGEPPQRSVSTGS